jgi:uncharacterized membrane protein YeaQ/YmgE (transglycosylase-associated protein family)
MEILTLIIWVLLGVWGSNIMKNKNRSELAGFIYGALLGLIGILICYLHSQKENTNEG